jgi:tetratricopeptide (TPR) repeat protein
MTTEWPSWDEASAQLRELADDDVFCAEERTLLDLLAEAMDARDFTDAVSSCRALVLRFRGRSEHLETLIGGFLAAHLLLMLWQMGDPLAEEDILLSSRVSLRPLRSVSSAGVNRREFIDFAVLLGGVVKDCGVLADGSTDVVVRHLEQGLRLCDKQTEWSDAAHLHFYLGTLRAAKMKPDPAVQHFTAARDIWLNHCQYEEAAEAEGDAGLCLLQQSRDETLERLRARLSELQNQLQALTSEIGDATETNEQTNEPSPPSPLVERETLHCDAAIGRLTNALRIAEHGQAASLYGCLYHHLGSANSHRGLMDESIKWLRRAVAWRQDHDSVDRVIFSKQRLARVLVERYEKAEPKRDGDLEAALQQLDETAALLEVSPNDDEWVALQMLKGKIYLHRSQAGSPADAQAAIACFERAKLRYGLLGETGRAERVERWLARAHAKVTEQS